MPILAIETATALVGRQVRGSGVHETQLLEFEGRGADGRPGRACLIFSDAVEPERMAPVGYVSEAADGTVDLVGWLPETAYVAYRNELAEGGALQLHFETRDRTSGYLRRLALGRADEALFAEASGRREQPGGRPRRPDIAFAMPL